MTEPSLLVRALETELDCASRIVDGFLGQMNVVHEIKEADFRRANAVLHSLMGRYKQLQTLFVHKYTQDMKMLEDIG